MIGVVTGELTRPMLRGWSHAIAILPAIIGATALVLVSGGEPAKRASVAVYGIALILLFTVSTMYHRGPWSPRVRAVWRRIDHANIFVMIAATYTPIAVTILDGSLRIGILVAIWVTAVVGIVLVATPIRMPRAVLVLLYMAAGWIAVVILPTLYARIGPTGFALLLAGGLLYTLGGVSYALKRPRLWPNVFGYHEVFHLLVIAASAMFFVFIISAVVPAHF
jgi:hemolysin III